MAQVFGLIWIFYPWCDLTSRIMATKFVELYVSHPLHLPFSLSLSISLDLLDSSHTELQQLFRDKLLERTWTFCNGSSKSDKKHVQVCSFFWPLSVNLSGTASLVHEPPLRARTHTHTLFLSSCPKKPYTCMHYATCLLTNFCHSAAKGVVESFGMLSPLPSHHSVNRFQSAINYAMEKKSAQ